MFYLLDPEKWERQKHFEYYMQMIPCGYTVTVRLDVENLYQQVKKCGLKFYPSFIYCALTRKKNLRWESIRKEDLVILM